VAEPLVPAAPEGAALPVRRRLLLATSRLVYRHGIAATGIESILDAAGVARRSLYRHFPGGKDELVAAALADRSARTVGHVLDSARAVAGYAGPVATVLAVFDVVDAAARRPGYRGCPFLNAAAELPAEHPGRAVVLDHKRQMRRRLGALLREAGAAPDDADRLGAALLLLLDGALAAAGLTPHERPALLARSLAADLLARELTPGAPRAPARAAGSRG
jgi:AcrR family transcriptional regulator